MITTSDRRRVIVRWSLCAVFVLAAHVATAFSFMNWQGDPDDGGDFGDSVTLVELTPLQPPAPVAIELPPGPEQVQADQTPQEKPQEKVEEEKPEIPPEQESDVALPEKPPESPPPQPTDVTPPAPVTTAPQVARSRMSPRTWRSKILAMLERNKRYPTGARSRGEQGTAHVIFTIDRAGRVLASRISKSSQSALLDAETLALVSRAQPFPLPPDEIAGDEITLAVPVEFNIK